MTYIVEIFSIAAGAFYIYMGAAKYGWWKGISISGGFMPIVCGGAVLRPDADYQGQNRAEGGEN